jgi:hypothetical protein
MMFRRTCVFFTLISLLLVNNHYWAQDKILGDSVEQTINKDSIADSSYTNNGAFFLKTGYFAAQQKVENFEPNALSFGTGVELYFKKWVLGIEIDFTYRDHPDREKFFSKLRTPMLKIAGNRLVYHNTRSELYAGLGLGYLSSISPDYSNDHITPDLERYEFQNFVVVSGRLNYRFNVFIKEANKVRFVPEAYIEAFLPMFGHDTFYADRHPRIPDKYRAIGPGILFGIRLAISK